MSNARNSSHFFIAREFWGDLLYTYIKYHYFDFDPNFVRMLVEMGVDVNMPSKENGQTPL